MVILTDQSFLLFLANTIPVVPVSAANRVRYHRAQVVDIGKKLGISESLLFEGYSARTVYRHYVSTVVSGGGHWSYFIGFPPNNT